MIPVVNINKIRAERQIFEDAWQLVKRYYFINMASDEEEEEKLWDDLKYEAERIFYIKGDDAVKLLAKNMALGVIEYLEERYRIQKQKE